ncbi:MAG TPA: hypothetical protein VL017_02250 [Devosia sp.]|nr:hypothetical protein [Devosia sp.]
MTIMIGGHRLEDMTPLAIIDAVQDPAYVPYPGGLRRSPQFLYYRNVELLEAFGDKRLLNGIAVMDGTRRHGYDRLWSEQFRALRTGEMLRWAVGLGIVKRAGSKWRLIHDVPFFELVGPEVQQVSMQVRGLPAADQVIANIIWQRELARRERLRVKRIKKRMPLLETHIDCILRCDPALPIPDRLKPFAPGCRTIGEARTIMPQLLAKADWADFRAAIDVLHPLALRAEGTAMKQAQAVAATALSEAEEALDAEAMADF